MENGTKALLIAIAVIIAIIVIGLALIPLTSGQKLIKENSDMSDIEISTYNAKFEAYLGSNVSGTKAKQLLTIINQHNKANKEDDSRVIVVTGIGDIQDTTTTKQCDVTKVKSGSAYNIKVDTNTGYTSGGLIKTITITENK